MSTGWITALVVEQRLATLRDEAAREQWASEARRERRAARRTARAEARRPRQEVPAPCRHAQAHARGLA